MGEGGDVLRRSAALLCLLPVVPAVTSFDGPEEARWFKQHVGVYITAQDPRFGEYTLEEGVALAKRLGVRVARVFLTAAQGGDADFVAVTRSPAYRRVLESFDAVILTLGDWSGQQYDEERTERLYYDLAAYLLTAYAGTGRTLVLGLWETDHWAPLDERGLGFFRARHRGIVHARQQFPPKDLRLLDMIEVCRLDYGGGPCVTNTILPKVETDLVALSAWGYVRDLPRALSFIAEHMTASPTVGRRAVMIGELGQSMRTEDTERLRFFRDRLDEARAWGTDYAVLWELADREHGLVDDKSNGGAYLAPWFWLYRKLHCGDEPLVLEDFSEVRLSRDGSALDLLGDVEKTGLVVTDGSLRLDAAHPAFAIQIEGELLRGRARLMLPHTGHGTVTISDSEGHEAMIALREAVPLSEFKRKGVDLKRPRSLAIQWLQSQHPLLVEEVALSARVPASRSRANNEPMRSATVTAATFHSPETVLPLPPGDWEAAEITVTVPDRAGAAEQPRLAVGGTELPLAEALPPGSELHWRNDGRGLLRLGPVRTRQMEHWGLFPHRREGLNWNPEFGLWQPERRDTRGAIELSVQNPFLITGGRLTLYGRQPLGDRWGVEVSRDGKEWVSCPAVHQWRDEVLDCVFPARFPGEWGPTRRTVLRFWTQPDATQPDWVWTTCITSVRAILQLDTTVSPLPSGRSPFIFRCGGSHPAGRVVLRADRLVARENAQTNR